MKALYTGWHKAALGYTKIKQNLFGREHRICTFAILCQHDGGICFARDAMNRVCTFAIRSDSLLLHK